MSDPPRVLELFAGIGALSAAIRPVAEVALAVDISEHVLAVHALNFGAPTSQRDLAHLRSSELPEADLWWLSPPCQPYTVRGLQRDLDDHRARPFLRALSMIDQARPPMIALENVAGFVDSRARSLLGETLAAAGYEVRERTLCPTELGAPARRERYYLTASRIGFAPAPGPSPAPRSERLGDYLDKEPDPDLALPADIIERYRRTLRVVDPHDERAVVNCVTSAYHKSYAFSGSYLPTPAGGLRRFSPAELARLLHLPEPFRFPEGTSRKRMYKWLGNSLSVLAVGEVLRELPGFESIAQPACGVSAPQ